MAKTSSIERNKKRERMAKKFAAKRTKLKAIADNESLPVEDRFAARFQRKGNCGNQVGQAFAHSRAGFDDERSVLFQCFADRAGHRFLLRAVLEVLRFGKGARW